MTYKIKVLALLTFWFLGFWLFVRPYWTDKNSEVVWFVERFSVNGGLWATDFPCFLKFNDQDVFKTLPTWANEPPLFHYLGVAAKKLGLENQYHRVVTLLFYLLTVWGLVRLFVLLWPPSRDDFLVWLCFLLVPILAVHGTRMIPDWLMVASLVWGVVYLMRERFIPTGILFTLAITSKALAAFAILPILFGYVIFRRKSLKGPEPWILLLACLPMFGWLYFLKTTGIQNPFFRGTSATHHMGGSDFAILLNPHYWERFWIWNFRNGTSIVLMLAAFTQLWHFKKNWKDTVWQWRVIIVWALAVVPFWFIVRGTQMTAPWYSFSFVLAWSLLGVLGLYRLPLHWRWLALGIHGVLCLSQVGWTTDVQQNLQFQVKQTPIGLHCPEAWQHQ